MAKTKENITPELKHIIDETYYYTDRRISVQEAKEIKFFMDTNGYSLEQILSDYYRDC